MSGSQIYDRGGDEKSRYAAWTTLQQLGVLALDDVESPNAAGHVDAGHFRNIRSNLQIRHAHGEVGRRQRDLNESPHFFEFFFLDPVERFEVADFAGNCAIKCRGIKVSDGANAALPRQEVLPDFLGADPQTAD